eukprot:Pompholyxophrys_punicea_v1_NODE_10_length_6905_cov_7.951686.p8 type:complete len:117 gc:universal NODE_10_length_6905_cov_7.951686:6535-6885(+)
MPCAWSNNQLNIFYDSKHWLLSSLRMLKLTTFCGHLSLKPVQKDFHQSLTILPDVNLDLNLHKTNNQRLYLFSLRANKRYCRTQIALLIVQCVVFLFLQILVDRICARLLDFQQGY